MTVDYPLLRQLLIKQLFRSAEQSAELVADTSGCTRVTLRNPQLASHQASLRMVADATAVLGVGILGNCTQLLSWNGQMVVLGKPKITTTARSLLIEPVDSWLADSSGKRITSGRIWDLIKDRAQPWFGHFRLDLAPVIDSLESLLPDFLPHRTRQQLQNMVGSLRLDGAHVSPVGVTLTLGLAVEAPPPGEPPRPEGVLSAAELAQWEQQWQAMDAMLTFAIKHYAAATHREDMRQVLLDLLIDSRYRLNEALSEPPSRGSDPVRRWFLDSWERLNPVIREIGLEEADQEPWLWIGLLTATDALRALDRLGPTVGLEISIDGLRRLARMISKASATDPLRYDRSVDPELQQLWRKLSTGIPDQSSGFRFSIFPIGMAWATEDTNRLDRWVPTAKELDEYLPVVAGLLRSTAKEVASGASLTNQIKKLFRNLVLSTAWQESCWRQYVVIDRRIEPLRSASGDVGIMQINEKIWRGFYDLHKLRWSIAYNSRAGSEILLDYLTRHALKQGEHKHRGGSDNLARASYSAYNGGPREIARYRKKQVSEPHRKIDASFWEKYRQVKAGKELQVAACLTGEAAVAGTGVR